MNGVIILWPEGTPVATTQNASALGLTNSNPPMNYDVTAGVPTSTNPAPNGFQFLVPPFTNLAALMYEINSAGPAYGWNPIKGVWTQF